MESNNVISEELLEKIIKDKSVRTGITTQSHLMFLLIYFKHYVKYQLAEFHKNIIRITEDTSNKLACVVAFRNSGKSTLVTLSYSIWAILGVQQKKFVLIISQTQQQAKQHMLNLKSELETNTLLKNDLGPFKEEAGMAEWAVSSLVFQNTGARIMIASIDQSIRGARHNEYRPDLIILDDVEDVSSTKTRENRDKIFDWFTREIMPIGDISTRVIILGNYLHEDSLIMRLKAKIDNKEIKGICLWIPFLDSDKKCLWPGKFDTEEKIQELRKNTANELAWRQEYLLEIVSPHDRVIQADWIKYYDEMPNIDDRANQYVGTFSGVDLAISDAKYSDYTAMVSVRIFGYGSKRKYYVLPYPINEKLLYPRIKEKLKEVSIRVGNGSRTTLYIESVGFQRILADNMRELGFNGIDVPVRGDKRERLSLVSPLIENGTILFPKKGTELLIAQLVYFGIERHDDLCDALVLVISEMEKTKPSEPGTLARLNPDTPRSAWDDDKFYVNMDMKF